MTRRQVLFGEFLEPSPRSDRREAKNLLQPCTEVLRLVVKSCVYEWTYGDSEGVSARRQSGHVPRSGHGQRERLAAGRRLSQLGYWHTASPSLYLRSPRPDLHVTAFARAIAARRRATGQAWMAAFDEVSAMPRDQVIALAERDGLFGGPDITNVRRYAARHGYGAALLQASRDRTSSTAPTLPAPVAARQIACPPIATLGQRLVAHVSDIGQRLRAPRWIRRVSAAGPAVRLR